MHADLQGWATLIAAVAAGISSVITACRQPRYEQAARLRHAQTQATLQQGPAPPP